MTNRKVWVKSRCIALGMNNEREGLSIDDSRKDPGHLLVLSQLESVGIASFMFTAFG